MKREDSNIFLGVVLDNIDPKRMGRCKIMVYGLYDNIPTTAVPWASPDDEGYGATFNIPDKGKIVSVVFEGDSIYKPIYSYSKHKNASLIEKLKSLNDEEYESFKAVYFDYMTQIYRSKSDGLVIDHMFNQVAIKKDGIVLRLKDNSGRVDIGSEGASQQAILGNHYLNWFEELVNVLLSVSFLGNLQAPVLPSPQLLQVLGKFKGLKETKFLSDNVNLVDNNYVKKIDRIMNPQLGDNWKDVTRKNTLVSNAEVDFIPSDNTATPTDVNNADPANPAVIEDTNKDVLALIEAMNKKEYILYEEPYRMNIVGVRLKKAGEEYTNKFDDTLYIFYKDDTSKWIISNYKVSTLPSNRIYITPTMYYNFDTKPNATETINKYITMKEYFYYLEGTGVPILAEAQYINSFSIARSPSFGVYAEDALVSISDLAILYDEARNSNNIVFSRETVTSSVKINIQRGYPSGKLLDGWGTGNILFDNETSLRNFIDLCRLQVEKATNTFTFTLLNNSDIIF